MKDSRRYEWVVVAVAMLLALVVWRYYHDRLKHIERQIEQMERGSQPEAYPE